MHFIPYEGYTLAEMDKIIDRMLQRRAVAVFVSPVPYLIQQLARLEGRGKPVKVYVMHTDERMLLKAKTGKPVSIAAKTGWVLT
jgi:RNase adaptor protein for sRNA GlmZ degradation